MSLYHDIILDHYRNPRNFGVLEGADSSVREENAGCGDTLEVFVRKGGGGGQLITMKWRGQGCAISMAAASLLSVQVSQIGQISRMSQIREGDMVKMLGGEISPTRMKCATLALKALQKALEAQSKKLAGSRVTSGQF